MCCIFCEEPVRSVTLSIAAVGVVAVIKMVRAGLTSRDTGDAVQSSADGAVLAIPGFADRAP
jgi:hypothetical protein